MLDYAAPISTALQRAYANTAFLPHYDIPKTQAAQFRAAWVCNLYDFEFSAL